MPGFGSFGSPLLSRCRHGEPPVVAIDPGGGRGFFAARFAVKRPRISSSIADETVLIHRVLHSFSSIKQTDIVVCNLGTKRDQITVGLFLLPRVAGFESGSGLI